MGITLSFGISEIVGISLGPQRVSSLQVKHARRFTLLEIACLVYIFAGKKAAAAHFTTFDNCSKSRFCEALLQAWLKTREIFVTFL